MAQQLFDTNTVDFKKLNKESSGFHLNSVDIYRSDYSQTNRQILWQCVDHIPTMAEIFRAYYRLSWLFMLDGTEENLEYPELTNQTHSNFFAT